MDRKTIFLMITESKIKRCETEHKIALIPKALPRLIIYIANVIACKANSVETSQI